MWASVHQGWLLFFFHGLPVSLSTKQLCSWEFMQLRQQKQLLCLCEFKTHLPLYKYLEMLNLEFYILLAVIFINSLPSKWHSTVV